MSKTSLRIHPAVGFARLGNSEAYYLGPETSAGLPVAGQQITGGLPIKPGTEHTPITSHDLRDAQGRLKRQAARFRIFQYTEDGPIGYPSGASTEVTIGSTVDGNCVKDIVWTVHLANKKANCWMIESESYPPGLVGYEDGKRPPIRNAKFGPSPDPNDKTRRRQLVIDAGPRAIKASERKRIAFDKATPARYGSAKGELIDLAHYPKSFPASDNAKQPTQAGGYPITTLGEMTSEPNGRLLVLGAYGRACGFDMQGHRAADAPLNHDVDNDNWLDDTADGPVTALLVFENGTTRAVDSGAWVVTTDPAYAPQTRNVVTLWDDILNTWIERFALSPDVFKDGKYRPDFRPSFDEHVFPTLRAASMQMWNTNLPASAIKSHLNMDRLTAAKPTFNVMSFIRDPNAPQQASTGSPLMPLSLGDNQKSFLTLTPSQYFFISQWANGQCESNPPASLGAGEALDKAVLSNCLGGRFSPGIDLTFIVRDPNLYRQNWRDPAVGPFRINMRKLDYSTATEAEPFLSVGYIPLDNDHKAVEPGDLCKFMAVPWHTDYNSCATHVPDPNPGGKLTQSNVYSGQVNTTLFWSWPAQRPVAVYTYDDLVANNGNLPAQRYSVRGEGTAAAPAETAGQFNAPAMNVGRYQHRNKILIEWDKIGFVIQGPAIEGYDSRYPHDYYLEVQSLFKDDQSNLVEPWPNAVSDKVHDPRNR